MPDERQHNDSVDENMTVAPVRNGNGEITHFIAVKQDTIDQGRGEERASMLAQAVQNSSDLIGIANRAGEFTFVNEAVLKMIGYHPEELIGKHFGALISPDNPAAVAEGIGTKGLKSGGWNGDCIMRRRDETDFTASLNVGPIKDKEGRVTGMFGIARDISARKEKEAALRTSEEQFRQLADNIREVFFVLTPEPVRVAYLSPAYEEIWGRSRKEVYDRPTAWIESVHPEDREGVGSFFARLMQGIQSEMAYRILRPDNSVRWIEARSFPIRDAEGKLIRVVGIAEDTTVRRNAHDRLNVALEKLKEQTQDAVKLAELVDILQSCQNVVGRDGSCS
jgi:PAS domain S-box-containing protein